MLSFLTPYAELMRLHKPVGILNIFFPYLYGLFLAGLVRPTSISQHLLPLFLSSFLLRSLGCTLNDITDRNLDKLVARCCTRPMARGAVSVPAAYAFSIAQIGVFVMILPLHDSRWEHYYTVILLVMVAAYPYMKRVTNYAQVFLGATLGLGVVIGAAVGGVDIFDIAADSWKSLVADQYHKLHNTTVLTEELVHVVGIMTLHRLAQLQGIAALYLGYIVWSVVHDTVYAYQDVADDKKAGIKSMAVELRGPKVLLSVLSIVQVLLLGVAGIAIKAAKEEFGATNFGGIMGSWAYVLLTVIGNALVLVAMVAKVDLGNPASCAKWFKKGSVLIGSSIAMGLGADYLLTTN